MKKTLSLMAVALVAVLAACGSNSSDTAGGSDATTASTTATNTFNNADVMFAQMMIPHHEQAIEMSDMALDPTMGASEEILDLAFLAEAHHPLDAGAIVPAPVEQHDFAGCRKVRHIALEVPLGALALGRCREGDGPADAGI